MRLILLAAVVVGCGPAVSVLPAADVPVKTWPSPLAGLIRESGRTHRSQRLGPLLNDMLIVVLDEGAGEKARSRKDEIVRDLGPDFVDWSVFGELARQYGIRSSTGGCEYQEYYKNEGNPDLQAREKVWRDRDQLFGDKGFVRALDGKLVQDETWGEGGYFMCHNGKNWHSHFLDSITYVAQRHLAITQDNIACSVFNRIAGCYCAGCQTRFRQLLPKRFTPAQLSAQGVDKVADFSIQRYIVDHNLTGDVALADPIVREYIKFQYVSGLTAWADCVSQVKRVGMRQNRMIPCGGNQINVWGTWPYAVAMSSLCDFIEVEELVGVKDKVNRRPLQYKMGLASGNHEKPVWVRGPVTDNTKPKSPMLSRSFWTVHLAEALANGGIREFSLGINQPWTSDPATKDYIDSPELYKLYVDFARWMREHRPLLTNRESAARVGLVYSLPTLMFRRYDALKIEDGGRVPRFEAVSKLLERNQIPYDAVVFGHPELWDDARTFEWLRGRYEVLILPRVDAATPEQIKLLGELAAAGVKLLADEAFTRDENLNPRTAAPADPKTLPATDEDLIRYGRAAGQVEINAPETVSVNVWRSCGGKSLDVHLLNYDADVAGEKIRPVENLSLRVRLPHESKPSAAAGGSASAASRPSGPMKAAGWPQRCLLSRFGSPDEELRFTVEGEWVKVTVPRLEAYAIVSFTDRVSIEAARRQAELRRERDIQSVRQLAQKLNLY